MVAALGITAIAIIAAFVARKHWETDNSETLKAGCAIPPDRVYAGFSIPLRDYQLPAEQRLLECEMARTRDNIQRRQHEYEQLAKANPGDDYALLAKAHIASEQQHLEQLNFMLVNGPKYPEVRKALSEWSERCSNVAIQKYPERKEQCVRDEAAFKYRPVEQ